MTDTVRLTGDKVQLREFRADDLDDADAILGDDRVTRWLSFDSRTRAQQAHMLTGVIERAQHTPRTEYYLAVTPHTDDRLIGFARLGLSGVQAAKLGCVIAAPHWRHGYALDAARTLINYGFTWPLTNEEVENDMTTELTRFAEDPIASESAQFPLARPMGTPDNTDLPSPEGVRPRGLRGMKIPLNTGQRIKVWRYDHERQVAVDGDGTPLNETWMEQPTAEKVTSCDGDEGPSEDYRYDFAPDAPFPPA